MDGVAQNFTRRSTAGRRATRRTCLSTSGARPSFSCPARPERRFRAVAARAASARMLADERLDLLLVQQARRDVSVSSGRSSLSPNRPLRRGPGSRHAARPWRAPGGGAPSASALLSRSSGSELISEPEDASPSRSPGLAVAKYILPRVLNHVPWTNREARFVQGTWLSTRGKMYFATANPGEREAMRPPVPK